MTKFRQSDHSTGAHFDSRLMSLVEEIGDKIQNGESLDIEFYVNQNPQHADYLRQLVQTLRDVAALGSSQSEAGSHHELAVKQVGEFKLIRQISEGGMGIVYEALQESLDRHVALKILRFSGVLDERQLVRFKNEARAAATLHHPHIVPVFNVGSERGVYYYAMQYIDGPSMAEVIQAVRTEVSHAIRSDIKSETSDDRQPNVSEEMRLVLQRAISTKGSRHPEAYFCRVAKWGIQAADALAFAHESGVLHRDIKPGNLLLDRAGNLWITDFGLTRLESQTAITATGELYGTIRYMSPEQVLGKRVLVDHRSDIYSLGVTLYELLGLQPAFDGNDRQELLRQIAFSEPKTLREIDSTIPIDLENVLLKSMAKESVDRYQSAQELAEDLQRFLANKPVVARRHSTFTRASRWIRGNRTVSISTAVVFAALLSAAAWATWSSIHIARSARESKHLLFLNDMRLATIALDHYYPLEARDLLARHALSANQLDDRGFAWHYLWSRANPPDRLTFREHQAGVRVVVCSPNGTTVASGDDDGKIFLWDLHTGKTKASYSTAPVVSLQFFPDGSALIVGNEEGRLETIEIENERLVRATELHYDQIIDIVCSPDQSILYSAADDGSLFEWQADQLVKISQFPVFASAIFGIALRENELYSVTTSQTNIVQCWNSTQRALVFERELPASLRCVAFSPDRSHLACGTVKGDVVVVDVHDGSVVSQCKVSQQRIYELAFSNDGKKIAVAGKDNSAHVVDSASGTILESFVGHEWRVHSIAFAANDQTVVTASADGTCTVFPLAKPWVEEPLPHRELISHAILNPTGSHVYWEEDSGDMHLQSEHASIQLSSKHVWSPIVVFSDDGRALVTLRSPLIEDLFSPRISWNGHADMDGDGDLDLVGALGPNLTEVWQENELTGSTPGRIRTRGHGVHSQVAQMLPVGNHPSRVARLPATRGNLFYHQPHGPSTKSFISDEEFSAVLVDDLDGDELLEVLFRSPREFQHYKIATAGGSIVETSRTTRIPIANPAWLAAQDMDGDGRQDIVLADSVKGEVRWYRQTSDLQFGDEQVLVSGLDHPELLVIADIDKDGVGDLVCSDQGIVVWMRKFANEKYGEPQELREKLDKLSFAFNTNHLTIWDTATGEPSTKLNPSAAMTADQAALSPNHQLLAVCGTAEKLVRILRLPDASQVSTLQLSEFRVKAMQFSPKGELLAIGHGDSALIWDFRSQRKPVVLQGHDNAVHHVLFSNDGRMLITLSDDQTIKFWDVNSGLLKKTLFDFSGTPLTACFVDEGRTLAAATDLGVISLWDIDSGQMLTEIKGLEGQVKSLAFNNSELVAIVIRANDEWSLIRIGPQPSENASPLSADSRPLHGK